MNIKSTFLNSAAVNKIAIFGSIALLLCCLTLFSNCTDKCGSTTCNNGGTCSNNVCICPTGFSGNGCQTAWSDKFTGVYKCTQYNCVPASSVSDTFTWLSTIAKAASNGGYTITITNFDNTNTTQTATVDSAGEMTIAPSSGSYGVSGKGTYAAGTIVFKFTTYSLGGPGPTCDMNLVKQ
jgi:hypothetical protein